MISKTDAKLAFYKLARIMDKSTECVLQDFTYNPGAWALEFFKGGKVQVIEITDKEGKFIPVTEKITTKEFIVTVKQMELINKKESVHG
jgi:hypothetical protein